MSSGLVRHQLVRPEKVERSRALRKQGTPAEEKFWEFVKQKQFHGFRFRRQQVVAGFIVDFYCETLSLVVELDGGVHDGNGQPEYDRERDEVLAGHGLKVARIKNEDVFKGREKVWDVLEEFRES